MALHRVDRVVFDRFVDEDIEKLAVCEITRSTNGFFENSIYDRRMGTTERGKFCETCCSEWRDCIGGYGRIRLPVPYYFYNQKFITSILQNICLECGACLLGKKNSKRVKTCDCGGENANVKEERDETDVWFDGQRRYSIEEIRDALHRIRPAARRELGLRCDPRSLMTQQLLVIPTDVRPYLKKGPVYLHNDVSSMYNSIFKDSLKKQRNVVESMEKVTMLLTQKNRKTLPNSSKVPQSLQDKIQGKEGLINSNINGKRVNHSSRANITGYASGDLGTVGVPVQMADRMTVGVPVAALGDLGAWVRANNPVRLKKPNGRVFQFLPATRDSIVANANPLDTVERRVVDGDVVLFNRQPSLRPESLIAMRVKIIRDCNTFRLCLPCTPPLNADFDGDECNIHVLQDMRARAEIVELTSPCEQIISSQKGSPLIVPVQDAVVGVYLMTSNGETVSRSLLCDMAVAAEFDPTRFPGEELPARLALSGAFDVRYCYENRGVRIVDGVIREGVVTKSILCSFGGIVHDYYFKIGKTETCLFIDKIQRITNLFLHRRGFSIGIRDCCLPKVPLPEIVHTEEYANTLLGRLERRMEADESNNFFQIVKSGAKASMTNIVQVSQCVGQQSIDGTRVRREMRTGRSLASLRSGDDTLAAYGFVFSSFVTGLTKAETIFHCKAGRRGVADSVTKVSESGYLSKKLTKCFENLVVEYDYTVRQNTNKQIVQFRFGGDGLNPQRMRVEGGVHKPIVYADMRELGLAGVDVGLQRVLLDMYLNDAVATTCDSSGAPCVYDAGCKRRVAQLCFAAAGGGERTLRSLIGAAAVFDPTAVARVERLLFAAQFQPMTPIGLITGTNFGEISSQLLLKSFHHTGIKNKDISGGIKRLNQLLCRTRQPVDEMLVVVARIDDPIYRTMHDCARLCDTVAEPEYVRVRKIIEAFMDDRARRLVASALRVVFASIVSSIRILEDTVEYVLNHDMMESLYVVDDDVFAFSARHSLALRGDVVVAGDGAHGESVCDATYWLVQLNKRLLAEEIRPGAVDRCDIDTLEDGSHELVFRGTKMIRVLEIPFVDVRSVYSTSPFENYEVFGIEGARKNLYDEIIRVLQFDGADIDRRYISLICDAMCVEGQIRSISHIVDVVTNAFFEKEVKKANAYSLTKTVDKCRSVEAAVLLGHTAKMGTGGFDVYAAGT